MLSSKKEGNQSFMVLGIAAIAVVIIIISLISSRSPTGAVSFSSGGKTDNTPVARECVQLCMVDANLPASGVSELNVDDCIAQCLQARSNQNVRGGQCSASERDGCCNVFSFPGQDPDCDSDDDGFANSNDCSPLDPSVNPGASDAACNGVDNDCDGSIDESYVSVGCNTGLLGACSQGQTSCNGFESCQQTVFPAAEQCADSIDNDCDGLTDGADSDCGPSVGECSTVGVPGFCVAAGTLGCQSISRGDVSECTGLYGSSKPRCCIPLNQ